MGWKKLYKQNLFIPGQPIDFRPFIRALQPHLQRINWIRGPSYVAGGEPTHLKHIIYNR